MILKALKKPSQTSPENQLILLAISEYAGQLQEVPYLGGSLLKRVNLTTSPLKIPHSLGVVPAGWWIVRQGANAVVYEGAVSPLTDRFITLKASASCTVDIWVF